MPNVYVLEVNPRASRTVPFVSKATGMPLAKAAAKVMVGVSLAEQGYTEEPDPQQHLRQGGRLPLRQVRRHRHRARAGDEIDRRGDGRQRAVFRSLSPRASWRPARCCPPSGKVFISVTNRSKEHVADLARRLEQMGFELLATKGTAVRLEEAGIRVQTPEEAPRGASQRARLHDRRQPATGHQHAQRQGGPDRRGPHSRRGRFARHPLHHHARRRRRPPSARWKPCARRR